MTHLIPVLAIAMVLGTADRADGGDVHLMPDQASLPENLAAPDPYLLNTYRTCARTAKERHLTHSEVTGCLDAYTRLKLSFLPDVPFETYMRLAPDDRWAINQRAYAAYAAWLARTEPTQ